MLAQSWALRAILVRSTVVKMGIGTAFLLVMITMPSAAFAVSWGAVWTGLAMVAVGVVMVAAAPAIAAAATAALVTVGITNVVIAATAVSAAGTTLMVAGIAVEVAGGLEKPAFLFGTAPVPAAAPPAPPPPPPKLLGITPVSQLALPGDSADAFVSDVNQTIVASNALAGDMVSNPNNVAADLANLYATLDTDATGFNQVFDTAGANIPQLDFTQAQIDAAQAEIGSSCFPSAVATAAGEIGLSATDTAALCSYVGSSPLSLAVPSVTPSQLLLETGQLTPTPEPSSLRLMVVALLVLIFVHPLRRGRTDSDQD